jgi:hypothetical protein
MGDLRSAYDFCGTRLEVETDVVMLNELFHAGFERFFRSEQAAGRATFHLRITTGEPVKPEAVPLVWSGPLPEGGSGQLFEDDGRCVLVVDGACSLDIRIGSSSAVATVAPMGMRGFMGSASMLLVSFVLRVGRQWLVHAACLINPRSDRAILIFAPSGYGKTSAAIALARGGFQLMTDDASVIGEADVGVQAWGMPRDLKVHRRTAELLPWLEALLGSGWDKNGEQPVRLAAVERYVNLCSPEPKPLEAIIVLGKRTTGPHRLARVQKGTALLMIVADNIPWHRSGVPSRAREAFAMLGRAVASVPTFQLNAGPDLDMLHGLFFESLGQAGSAAQQDW